MHTHNCFIINEWINKLMSIQYLINWLINEIQSVHICHISHMAQNWKSSSSYHAYTRHKNLKSQFKYLPNTQRIGIYWIDLLKIHAHRVTATQSMLSVLSARCTCPSIFTQNRWEIYLHGMVTALMCVHCQCQTVPKWFRSFVLLSQKHRLSTL